MLEKTYACPGGMFDFVFCIDRCHFDKAPVIKSLREWFNPEIRMVLRTSYSSGLTNRQFYRPGMVRKGNVFRAVCQPFCSRDGVGQTPFPGGRSPYGGSPPGRTWNKTGSDIINRLERTWDQTGSDIMHPQY